MSNGKVMIYHIATTAALFIFLTILAFIEKWIW